MTTKRYAQVHLDPNEWPAVGTESLQQLCEDAEESIDLLHTALRQRVAAAHPTEYEEALKHATESVEGISMSWVEPVAESKSSLVEAWALLAIGAKFGDGRM